MERVNPNQDPRRRPAQIEREILWFSTICLTNGASYIWAPFWDSISGPFQFRQWTFYNILSLTFTHPIFTLTWILPMTTEVNGRYIPMYMKCQLSASLLLSVRNLGMLTTFTRMCVKVQPVAWEKAVCNTQNWWGRLLSCKARRKECKKGIGPPCNKR